MTFSAQWGPLCEIFCFGGPKLCFSVKQWTISVPSPFQRFKMLFKFKKDQSCKNFTIWAKIVKVAKKKGYNRENWNFRDLNCFHWKICRKILISITFGVKMSRKSIQGPNRKLFNKRVEKVNFKINEGLKQKTFKAISIHANNGTTTIDEIQYITIPKVVVKRIGSVSNQ